MKSDYRNTEYCPSLLGIIERKSFFKESMIQEHPRLKNHYSLISNKDAGYKGPFIRMYNDKCVYCGTSLLNVCVDFFEIDHYINEKSFKSLIEAGQIENLVPACQNCNRGKGSIVIDKNHIDLLDPEKDKIKEVFIRETNYRIIVAENYNQDDFIINFYNALGLDRETKRLDFLLLNLKGLFAKCKENEKISNGLLKIINELQNKRNTYYG